MERAVVFAGFGGQGLLFAGQVLAQAALAQGRGVLWIPSYGPEMRGGTASCTVIIGDEPIGSPVVDAYVGVVALNAPSAAKFASLVARDGVLLINSDAVSDDAENGSGRLALPLAQMALDAGDGRSISVVALGALAARLGLVSREALERALTMMTAKHPEILAADLAALSLGWRAGQTSAD
jgi:2-oxoglutarate ferredoxin oxidoreductase subunit gamma